MKGRNQDLESQWEQGRLPSPLILWPHSRLSMLLSAHLLHSPLLADLPPLFSIHTAEDGSDDPQLLPYRPHSKD